MPHSDAALDSAWNSVLASFAQRDEHATSAFDPAALHVLSELGAEALLVDFCAEQVRADIDSRLIPRFWAHFAGEGDGVPMSARRTQCAMLNAVHEMHRDMMAHTRALQALETHLGPAAAVPPGATSRSDALLLAAYSQLVVRVPPGCDLYALMVTFWDRSFLDHFSYRRQHGALPPALSCLLGGARASRGEGAGAGSGGAHEEEADDGADDDAESDAGADIGADDDLEGASVLSAEQMHAARAFVQRAAAEAAAHGGGTAMEVESATRASAGAAALEVLLGSFALCCEQLRALSWLRHTEGPLSMMLNMRLYAHVHAKCATRFDARLLSRVLRWLSTQLLPWLEPIGRGARATAAAPAPTAAPGVAELDRAGSSAPRARASDWSQQLRLFVYETFGSLRIGELFEIITDFPESTPALEDLAESLKHTHQHAELTSSVRAALGARLLRPGANTAQVLQVYMATIRALQLLDPSGVLLQRVSAPVCEYLKRRPDTVRQIVTGLTDDSATDLADALGGADAAAIVTAVDGAEPMADGGAHAGLSLVEAAKLWTPLPIEADPTGSAAARARGDVLSILVSVYGSKELFVNEYRAMLADKLLGAANVAEFDIDRERRHLEMLKVRFGESALHMCEIMLKDLTDSRRIGRTISEAISRSPLGLDGALSVTIISRMCWPALSDEPFKNHPLVERSLKRFEKQYAHFKSPRKLVWKGGLGSVTLDLEIGGQLVADVVCTPAQATVMLHFGDAPRWTLAGLAAKMDLAPATLRKRIAHWVARGYITELESAQEPTFEVVSSLGRAAALEHHQPHDEDGARSSVMTSAAASEKDLEIYASYVTNMLTNLGKLTLARIHNMLKMFVTEPLKYDKTEQQLQALLMTMVEEEKLEFVGGEFTLAHK